jgi:uncharacterized protein (TIGR03437 family)
MRVPNRWRLAALLGTVASVCSAQAPQIAYRGIFNAASRMPAGLPGGAIARGSIFTITGLRLGPTSTPDLGDPLQTTLGAVSIAVTQGTTTVNAIPVAFTATSVNAIMPSNTPLGMSSVRITYKGVKSNPMPVRVVNSQFGIFTASGAGNGPGMIQNDNGDGTTTGNSLQTPAQLGQTVYLTGTGLGPIASDTAAAPDPSNLTVQTEVFVGGVPASVLTNGRSAPGADQIGFTVPALAPLGCWTPVYVRTAGASVSNFATMSLSADGSPCQEPNNMLASGLINGGAVAAYATARIAVRHDAGVVTPRDSIVDKFGSYQVQQPLTPTNFNPMFALPPAGSCTVYNVAGDLTSGDVLVPGIGQSSVTALDSGTISVIGDKGTQMINGGQSGLSGVQLGYSLPSLPLVNYTFLDSPVTVTTSGGIDIGTLTASADPPQPFSWTNRDAILAVTLSSGLTVNWSGAADGASVFIVGGGVDLPSNSTSLFLCVAPGDAGSFAVPADVLANIPVTRARAIQSKGVIYLGQWNLANPVGITATGVNFGALVPMYASGKTVSFQ